MGCSRCGAFLCLPKHSHEAKNMSEEENNYRERTTTGWEKTQASRLKDFKTAYTKNSNNNRNKTDNLVEHRQAHTKTWKINVRHNLRMKGITP